MIAANAYRIRFATASDADTLKSLAESNSEDGLVGRVIVGHLDGTAAAAMSLHDGRVIADPSRSTDRVVAALQMRAGAIHAFESTPSLRERLLATLPKERGRSNVVQIPVSFDEHDEREPLRAYG
jgi:hypothetical protein